MKNQKKNLTTITNQYLKWEVSMSSFTLSMLHAEAKTVCTTCENAIWMSCNDSDGPDFTPLPHVKSNDNSAKIACFCTILHTYILTPRQFCDGNIPNEPAGIDSVINK